MKLYTERIESFYESHPHLMKSPFSSDFGLLFLSPTLFSWLIGSMKGMKILDLGCGSGAIAEVLFDLGVEKYVGVDLVTNQFQEGLRKTCLRADIHDLSQFKRKNSQFDCVLLLDVMEHLQNPNQVLREVHEVLRPGGILFCSVPNYLNTAGAIKILVESVGLYSRNTWAPFGAWQRQEHETLMTAHRQRKHIINQKFEIIHHIGMDLASGIFPFFYGKNDIWLKGFYRRIYETFNRYMFSKAQAVGRWCSMFSVVVGRSLYEEKV